MHSNNYRIFLNQDQSMETEESTASNVRSRRNSLQPIDRHKDILADHGSIYINAGIDSDVLNQVSCALRLAF